MTDSPAPDPRQRPAPADLGDPRSPGAPWDPQRSPGSVHDQPVQPASPPPPSAALPSAAPSNGGGWRDMLGDDAVRISRGTRALWDRRAETRSRIAQGGQELAGRSREIAQSGRSAASSAWSAAAPTGAQAVGAVRTRAGGAVRSAADAGRRAGELRIGPDGRPHMPRALIFSAVAAMLAAFLMALTVLLSAFGAGRTLRVIAWLTDDTGIRALEWVHTISSGIAGLIMLVGTLLGLAIAAVFGIYAWRVLRGTGRARWVALAAVVCGSFTALPVEPLLGALFLLVSGTSVLLAFLPASRTWFAHRRALRSAQLIPRGPGSPHRPSAVRGG
ncbi:hypothetical protein ACXET9_05625 [Brachybacterium sp. DNPG3]